MYWLPLLILGDSDLLKEEGCCASSAASELKLKEPRRLVCWFWVNASRRSSVVNLMRCRLLPLNQERWLLNSVPVFFWLVFIVELPPNATVLSPVDPSGKVDVMRTVPLGISRYGVP
jgi:hypothetical protein